MGRSLKYEISGQDPRVAASEVAASGWSGLFEVSRAKPPGSAESDADRRMVLEIGFGRGEFLLWMASSAPEVDFVGIEVSFKRTLKMARKVARAGLANVLLLEARAEVAIPELLDEGAVAEIWINFSDPWPKARHARRRLIQSEFVRDATRALAAGGTLYIATDDVPYAHQIDAVLAGQNRLANRYSPWPFLSEVPGRKMTGYEQQWRAEGRPLHFFAYGVTAAGGDG